MLLRLAGQCFAHVGQWAQSVFAAAQQAWPQDGFAAGHVAASLWQQADLQPVRSSAEAQRRSASIFMVFIIWLGTLRGFYPCLRKSPPG